MKCNKIKGFTLLEAMLALMVTIMCIEILRATLGVIKNTEKLSDPINEAAYSYVQLENFLKREKHVEIDQKNSNSRQIKLNILVSQEKEKKPIFKDYKIENYKNMVRLTTNEGGHIPLLLGVTSSSFSFSQDEFVIHINENNRGKSELVFKVDKPIVLEKKDKNEKPKEKTNNERKRTT